MAGTSPTAPQLGPAIRELRKRKQLTIEDLAGIAEIHPSTLSNIELGPSNPRWETVTSLASALAIESSALVRLAETMARARRQRAKKEARAKKPGSNGKRT